MYLYASKEEALVPIENIRATRKNVRNLPNIEIANWIADQRQLRKKIRQRICTNIIMMHTKKEAELQLLEGQFRRRTRDATRNITTMQQIDTNAVNNSNNNEMNRHSTPPPPEEEPPDYGEAGRKVAIDIEFKSDLDSEGHTLSSTRWITHSGMETVSPVNGSSS